MQLLFLDESGQLDRPGLFALAGLVVADREWAALRDAWQTTLRTHDWPLDREVKWHGIRQGTVPPEESPFFRSREDVYATGLMFLAERFHMWLERVDDVGVIVVDSRFREE